jgi:uncharacterized protein (DUF488 family)
MAARELFTIGYEGCRVGDVVARLRSASVGLLVDVRAVAASRKPGFSKRQLAAALDEQGIGYVHLRALGTPKPGRIAARAGRIDEMRAIFSAHLEGDAAQAALAEATSLASRRPCCLLCFESDHRACHRTLVAERIAARTAISVRHLPAPAIAG